MTLLSKVKGIGLECIEKVSMRLEEPDVERNSHY